MHFLDELQTLRSEEADGMRLASHKRRDEIELH